VSQRASPLVTVPQTVPSVVSMQNRLATGEPERPYWLRLEVDLVAPLGAG
jgi:hypothetical protein